MRGRTHGLRATYVDGWRAVRPQGRYSRGGVVRMTDAELEEVSDEQG